MPLLIRHKQWCTLWSTVPQSDTARIDLLDIIYLSMMDEEYSKKVLQAKDIYEYTANSRFRKIHCFITHEQPAPRACHQWINVRLEAPSTLTWRLRAPKAPLESPSSHPPILPLTYIWSWRHFRLQAPFQSYWEECAAEANQRWSSRSRMWTRDAPSHVSLASPNNIFVPGM